MVRTRFALILYFRMVDHKAACQTRIIKIYEDMIQNLLMLKVFFTQDSKADDLFCGAPSGSEPASSLAIYEVIHIKRVLTTVWMLVTNDTRYNDTVCYQRFCCKIEFAVIKNLIGTRLKHE